MLNVIRSVEKRLYQCELDVMALKRCNYCINSKVFEQQNISAIRYSKDELLALRPSSTETSPVLHDNSNFTVAGLSYRGDKETNKGLKQSVNENDKNNMKSAAKKEKVVKTLKVHGGL